MFQGNRNSRLGQDRAVFPHGCDGGRNTHGIGILDEGRAHYKLQLSIKLSPHKNCESKIIHYLIKNIDIASRIHLLIVVRVADFENGIR